MEEQNVMKGNQIEIMASVERETAEFHLKRLNWFFDQNPDHYLVQRPRVVYDSDGNEKKSVRYQIRQKEQPQEPAKEPPGQQAQESNQTGKEQSNESGTIQQ